MDNAFYSVTKDDRRMKLLIEYGNKTRVDISRVVSDDLWLETNLSHRRNRIEKNSYLNIIILYKENVSLVMDLIQNHDDVELVLLTNEDDTLHVLFKGDMTKKDKFSLHRLSNESVEMDKLKWRCLGKYTPLI